MDAGVCYIFIIVEFLLKGVEAVTAVQGWNDIILNSVG